MFLEHFLTFSALWFGKRLLNMRLDKHIVVELKSKVKSDQRYEEGILYTAYFTDNTAVQGALHRA